MKRFKKMMAIAIVAVMTMMYAVPMSFAAAGDRSTDGYIEVTGIDEGDVVNVYQFVTWVAGTTNNWVVNPAANITLDNIADGLTKDELAEIASHYASYTQVASNVTIGSDGKLKLSETPSENVPSGTTLSLTDGKLVVGSYLVLIQDKDNDNVYNPIVVSNDYDGGGNTVSLPDNKGLVKKQNTTLEKTITNNDPGNGNSKGNTVEVGDVVEFQVTGAIPGYNSNWTSPEFYITDNLSTGLTINDTPNFTLTVSNHEITTADYSVQKLDGTDVSTHTGDLAGGSGYKVVFKEAFLKGILDNPTYTITYKAKVGEAARSTEQTHEETNTATLTYSNNPTNGSDHGTVEDKTHHYTFAIDATRFGNSSSKTSELIKVAVDSSGNAITAYSESDPIPNNAQPLAGAVFTLTGTGYSSEQTSAADGSLLFNNLEVGTYTLKETSAPAGYMLNTEEVTVVVSATFNEDGTLKDYNITIGGVDTAHYSATTDASEVLTTITKSDSNQTVPFNNTKGASLPSTGGIGTTLFYLIGGLLVIGAGVVLVTRRRVNNE